ncbi:MAG: phage/plasmid primase, P4 family [Candidatus Nanopelagicales bacterium]
MDSKPQVGPHADEHTLADLPVISGEYLLDLLDLPPSARATEALDSERGWAAVDWHRQNIGHGRYPIDPRDGLETPNPYVHDLLAIPTGLIAPLLAQRGLDMPTRADYDAWLASTDGDPIDAELELWLAANITDPDLITTEPGERRICGVPESIYEALEPHEQKKVIEGLVIAPPRAPLFVARWLVRQHCIEQLRMPGSRFRAWMRTLIRIDQNWYAYESPAPGQPKRWVVHADKEWMRTQLQGVLGRLWYVHVRQLKAGNEYSLKSWNPDTKTLGEVEAFLSSLLAVEGGTRARELADHYGTPRNAYGDGVRIQVRNGLLDPVTGTVLPATPLWFSTTVIAADYDHSLDPATESEWLRMLRTQWPDDPGAIVCLQQWFGYVLSGRTNLQKWMLVIGPAGSGKSIIASVLKELNGSATPTKLDTLNSSFGLQSLHETGATLALLSDIRFGAAQTATAVGNLLAVTGEDPVIVERKYKPAADAVLGARFHASANEMPRWNDNTNALARRALLMETSIGFRGTDKEDHGLLDRIISGELAQILRWAVEGLALLNESGGVFTASVQADDLRDEMAELSSTVRTFVNECCEIGTEDEFLDLTALFTVFRHWTQENNTGKGMSKTKFNSAIRALYLPPVRPGQKRMPDGEKGKWSVVWGITRAECSYTDRGQHGPVQRTASTDDPALDPFSMERD